MFRSYICLINGSAWELRAAVAAAVGAAVGHIPHVITEGVSNGCLFWPLLRSDVARIAESHWSVTSE